MKRIRFLTVLSAAAMLTGLAAPAASAQTSHVWESYPSAVQSLYPTWSGLAHWAFNPGTSYITNGPDGDVTADPRPAGLGAQPVARFTSYADFAAQVGDINKSIYKWVMIDLESWTKTPLNEAQDPTTYMALFAQLAHANGFRVQFEPARDLARTDTVCPDIWGRDSAGYNEWYVKCRIAAAVAAAAAPGDQLLVQNQPDDTNLPAYDTLFAAARAQAPGMPVLGEVSSNYGTTSRQAYAAATSILRNGASGIYFTGGSGWLASVLRQLRSAGF